MACAPDEGQELECGIAELLARVCRWYLQEAAVPRAGRLPAPLCPARAVEGVLGTSKSDSYPLGYSGTGSLGELLELLAELPEHWAGGTECTEMALFRPSSGGFPQKVVQERDSNVPGKAVFLWSWFSLVLCFLTFSGHSSGSAAGLPRTVLKQNC